MTVARILMVTGTDTGVGKTIATAAIAAMLTARLGAGAVAAYKPVQSGVATAEPADMDVVAALAGVPTSEGRRLERPMAPVAAAAFEAATLPSMAEHEGRIESLLTSHDRVIVEGAGGVLVQLDAAGNTLADLAARCSAQWQDDVNVVVVCRSGLGTLNHTELTLEALSHRGLAVAGLVIGSWPQVPNDIDLTNRRYLAGLGLPLLAVIPAGAAGLEPARFRAAAPDWFDGLD